MPSSVGQRRNDTGWFTTEMITSSYAGRIHVSPIGNPETTLGNDDLAIRITTLRRSWYAKRKAFVGRKFQCRSRQSRVVLGSESARP